MKAQRAICPGSFDPVTFGHLDIIERTSSLFDDVVVGVGRNSAKNYLFDTEQRVALLRDVLGLSSRVTVMPLDGLLVDFCSRQQIDVIVKGLRFASDFEFELQMAQMNHELSGIETVCLPTSARWAHISSSMVREVARLGGDVSAFVPDVVAERVADLLAGEPEGSKS